MGPVVTFEAFQPCQKIMLYILHLNVLAEQNDNDEESKDFPMTHFQEKLREYQQQFKMNPSVRLYIVHGNEGGREKYHKRLAKLLCLGYFKSIKKQIQQEFIPLLIQGIIVNYVTEKGVNIRIGGNLALAPKISFEGEWLHKDWGNIDLIWNMLIKLSYDEVDIDRHPWD